MNKRHDVEIEDMRPVAWKVDGTPTRFEVVHSPQARIIGDDDAPIVSPLPEARVVRASSVVEGSWSDRARAFSITTHTLSAVTGVAFVVAAAVFGASLSFFSLALYFFSGFVLAWLVAYFLHTAISAEGAQMADTLLLWRFLFNEQRHRHGRYTPARSERDRLILVVLGALSVGAAVLFLLAVLTVVFWENMPR